MRLLLLCLIVNANLSSAETTDIIPRLHGAAAQALGQKPDCDNIPGLDDPPSSHGMLVFGKGPFYLSHLPMYHSPHDYQAIIEVELDEATQKLIRDNKLPYMTINPESFVLPQMIAKKGGFKAELSAGHFERGGKKVADSTVKIKRVIHFKKFNPKQAEEKDSFLAFGSQKEIFLAHNIGGKGPDFDQVSMASNVPDSLKSRIATGEILELKSATSGPLPNAETTFLNAAEKIQIKVQPIYTELDELTN